MRTRGGKIYSQLRKLTWISDTLKIIPHPPAPVKKGVCSMWWAHSAWVSFRFTQKYRCIKLHSCPLGRDVTVCYCCSCRTAGDVSYNVSSLLYRSVCLLLCIIWWYRTSVAWEQLLFKEQHSFMKGQFLTCITKSLKLKLLMHYKI